MIYTHDHEPSHVHVFHGEYEIVVRLDDLSVRENFGMPARLVRDALGLVAENREYLIMRWQEIKAVA